MRPRSPQPPQDGALQQRPNPLQSEDEFQAAVIAALQAHGFLVNHQLPGRTARGKVLTNTQGDRGCLDLVIAKRCVWLVELKTDAPDSQPTPDQRRWVAAAGDLGAVWRPRNWPWIRQWMRHPFVEDR